MKIKKILVTCATGALLLTGAGYAYQSYAAEGDTTIPEVVTEENTVQQSEGITASNTQETVVPPDPGVQDKRVDLSQLPEGVEVRIPESIKDTAP
ncbi:hypothetical protein ACPV3A_32085, partial [Paenibacillus sp. Dod16]